MTDLPTWETGIYAKVLRDADAARAQQTVSAAALWASVFGDAATWFDPDPLDAAFRPTECAAFRSLFHQARNAQSIWTEWQNMRDAALYAGELDVLAQAAEIAAANAAKRAELRAIRESQLSLPAPFTVAA